MSEILSWEVKKEPKLRVSECLLIGIDISDGKDLSVMQVSRRDGQSMTVLNTLYGRDAEEMYDILMGWPRFTTDKSKGVKEHD